MRNNLGQFTKEKRPSKKTGKTIECPNCNKSFYVPLYRIKENVKNCCSISCATTIKLTGKKKGAMSEDTKAKISIKLKLIYKDETKTTNWKGDNVGYFGVHDWMTKNYGQPVGCEVCGVNDNNIKYYWANLSQQYKRDRKDFKRMCMPCHRKYDGFTGKEWSDKVKEYMKISKSKL